MDRALPSGRAAAASQSNPQAVSSTASIPSAFAYEESSPGAAEWVAERLTVRQLQTIQKMAGHRSEWHQARSLGVSGATLVSLNDFRRGERGFLPPLSVVTSDHNPFTRCADWSLTKFGRRVAKAIEARSGETERLDPQGESAGRQASPIPHPHSE